MRGWPSLLFVVCRFVCVVRAWQRWRVHSMKSFPLPLVYFFLLSSFSFFPSLSSLLQVCQYSLLLFRFPFHQHLAHTNAHSLICVSLTSVIYQWLLPEIAQKAQKHKPQTQSQKCSFQCYSAFSSSSPSMSLIHMRRLRQLSDMTLMSSVSSTITRPMPTLLGHTTLKLVSQTFTSQLVRRSARKTLPFKQTSPTDRYSTISPSHSLKQTHPHRSRTWHTKLLLSRKLKHHYHPSLDWRNRYTLQHHLSPSPRSQH